MRAIARAIDIEGAFLLVGVVGLMILAASAYGWQGALAVLVVASIVAGIALAAPREPR